MPSEQHNDFRRLLKFIIPYRGVFIISSLALLGYAGVDILFLKLVQPLIDEGFSQTNPNVLKYAPLVVIGLLFLRGVFGFTSAYGIAWVGTRVVMTMRQNIFSRLVHMPVSYFDQNSSGELISKVTFNTEQVSNAVSSALVTLVREGATVIGMIGLMFYYSWQLSLVFLLIGPLVGFVIAIVGKRFRKVSTNIQAAMGEVTTASEQMLKGHKVVISYGGQEKEVERFNQISNHTRQQMMKLRATSAMSSPVIQVIGSFALAAVLFMASMPSILEALSPGAFASMVSAMIMILQPLKKLTNVQAEFQKGIAAARSIFELIDEQQEKDTGSFAPERVEGRVAFSKVGFTYPSKDSPALTDVSFQLEAGKTLALVGRSGSGKSTITQLLTRFYNADTGLISIDGESVEHYSLKALRRQIALVSQQVVLFNDTISNNIAYGMEDQVSQEQIEQAAKSAYALEFIEQLPEGFDTVIGENGINLSGGQRQRLAIARAILRNAPILILDEATSALDTESERYIQDALESLQKNCTSIVVAHRLSTIENANQIAVVDEGRIVEMGSHDELLARQGAYAQLHQLQFSQ